MIQRGNNVLTIKSIFRPSPYKHESDTLSERSLRSLANLMKRAGDEEARKTMPRLKTDTEYLSHSQSECLSGSSTTSIVNK